MTTGKKTPEKQERPERERGAFSQAWNGERKFWFRAGIAWGLVGGLVPVGLGVMLLLRNNLPVEGWLFIVGGVVIGAASLRATWRMDKPGPW